MTKLRPLHEIRAAAASPSLRKRAREILDRESDINRQRSALNLPSQRRAVVEEYYGKPLEKIKGPDRQTAEEVCVLHHPESVHRFSEYVLSKRSLPCESLARDFNRAYADELEREIANVTDQLTTIYSAYSEPFRDEYCPPIGELRRRLGLAREVIVSGGDGPQGIASAFNGVLQ